MWRRGGGQIKGKRRTASKPNMESFWPDVIRTVYRAKNGMENALVVRQHTTMMSHTSSCAATFARRT